MRDYIKAKQFIVGVVKMTSIDSILDEMLDDEAVSRANSSVDKIDSMSNEEVE